MREAKGEDAAERIAGLRKPKMVAAAEELLEGAGWLPEVLRTRPSADDVDADGDADAGCAESEAQSAEDGGEPAMGVPAPSGDDGTVAAHTFAAAQ